MPKRRAAERSAPYRNRVVGFSISILSAVIAVAVVLTAIHAFAANSEPGKDGIRRMGSITLVSRPLAERLKADNTLITYSIAVKLGPNGVKIVSVDRGSIAQRLGIAPGDTLRSVNGRKLSSTEDMSLVYEALKNETSFEVRVLRKGKPKTLRYEIR